MSTHKSNGIYLIQEQGCLNPFSGAFQHISMGVKNLSNHFDIKTYLNTQKFQIETYKVDITRENNQEVIKPSVKKGIIYGTLKDFQILIKTLIQIPSLMKLIKTEKPNFVYERASYLNYSGLIACNILGIPHFYEANGLQFKSRNKYYKSYFFSIAKLLEKLAYYHSTHTFFVGSYGDYWRIKKNNWTNVENGVELKKINSITLKKTSPVVTEICFVGRYAKHHRLDVLIDGLKLFNRKSLIRVNLIGTGLQDIEKQIKDLNIQVINHGFVDRSNIIPLISNFQIGLICGSPTYQSCMKLFDYGAACCTVLAPSIHNLKLWFPNELVFFDGSPKSFSEQLESIVPCSELHSKYSRKLQEKIRNQFTWDQIFKNKVSIINQNLHKLK